MPRYFTYSGLSSIYFIGVAINNNSMYDTPSKKAIILNTFNSLDITVFLTAKNTIPFVNNRKDGWFIWILVITGKPHQYGVITAHFLQ